MRLVVGLRPVSDTLRAEFAGGLGAGGRPSGALTEMRRGLGWAGWDDLGPCLGGLLVGLGLFQTSLGLRLGGLG